MLGCTREACGSDTAKPAPHSTFEAARRLEATDSAITRSGFGAGSRRRISSATEFFAIEPRAHASWAAASAAAAPASPHDNVVAVGMSDAL